MLLPILPQPASLWLSENLSETFYWPASLIYELPCHHQSSIFSWYALPTFTKKGNQKVRSGGEIYVKTNFLGRFFCTTFKGGHFYWTFFPTTNLFVVVVIFYSWFWILRLGHIGTIVWLQFLFSARHRMNKHYEATQIDIDCCSFLL